LSVLAPPIRVTKRLCGLTSRVRDHHRVGDAERAGGGLDQADRLLERVGALAPAKRLAR